MSDKPLPPFSCTHTPNVPELLNQLGVTLAISTYQAGKVIFLSAVDNESLVQLPRNFKKAMGMAFKPGKMALAVQDEVIVLADSPQLAATYPPKPGVYDAMFLPRASYYTGGVDLHDIEWVGEELWAVNTLFSCLARIDTDYSFRPVWKPDFISQLAPEDRCHLNGVCFEDGKPKYVTALGRSDSREGWRPGKATGGIVMDVARNEVVCEGLPMPHSPRIINGQLYCLLSAAGQLIRVDPASGSYEVVHDFEGYVRGMDHHGDYLFVGLSKIRRKSSAFGDLPIAEKALKSGVEVLYLPSMSKLGRIQYENSVDELYDVRVMEGMSRPNVLSTLKDDFRRALVTPDATYWARPNEEVKNN